MKIGQPEPDITQKPTIHASGSKTAGAAPPKKVVVVGGANVDIVGQALQPMAQGDSTPGHMAISRGGVGRNLAENMARLGMATQLFSAVGSDDWGRMVCQQTGASGVDVSGVFCSSTLPSAQYLSLVQPDGSLHAAINDMRVLEALSPEVLRQQGLDLSAANALVLDCNLQADTLAWLLDHARVHPGLLVVVDAVSAAKCTKIRGHLAHIDLLKVNPLEAQALTGLTVTCVADAKRAAHWLWQQGVGRTVLSLGKQGVCWCDAKGQVGFMATKTATNPVQIVNTNGAGDALLAGALYGLLAAFSWPQVMQWGMACAALTLTVATANAEHLSPQAVQAIVLAELVSDQTSALLGENQPHET